MGTWPELEVASGTPVRVPGIPRVVAVSVATDLFMSPGLALLEDGTVQAWGCGWGGQLGDGTMMDHLQPIQAPGLTEVVAIVASEFHAHAVRADGTAVGWGETRFGLIGDGSTPYHPTPVRVPLPRHLTDHPAE